MLPLTVPQEDLHHTRIINKLPGKTIVSERMVANMLQSNRQNVVGCGIESTGSGVRMSGSKSRVLPIISGATSLSLSLICEASQGCAQGGALQLLKALYRY